MKLYVVRREAVYNHETVGIFDELEKAEQVAGLCAAYDYDGHHKYVVYSTKLNEAKVLNVSTGGAYDNPVIEIFEEECSFYKEER